MSICAVFVFHKLSFRTSSTGWASFLMSRRTCLVAWREGQVRQNNILAILAWRVLGDVDSNIFLEGGAWNGPSICAR